MSEYPSVALFFGKSKKNDGKSKNDFVTSKSNETIQNVLDEENEKSGSQSNENIELKVLREQNKLLQKELKQAKVLLRKANDVNMQKDLQIAALKQQLNNNKEQVKPTTLLYENHAHRFDAADMKKIRSIKGGERNDSSFILTITRALYKNEEHKVKDRRVTSRKYKDTSKLEMSAEKKEIMSEMLKERVIDETANESDEAAKRLKKLNDHMRNGLKNSIPVGEKKQNRNQSTGAANTQATSNQFEAIVSQENYFSSSPIVHPHTAATQNMDRFGSHNLSSYALSPVHADCLYQHTSQPLQLPNYSTYHGQYQPFPVQGNWAQN